MQKAIHALDLKHNVSESPVKRTFAKLRHPFRALVASTVAEQAFDRNSGPKEMQAATANYTTGVVHGVVKETADYFQTGEGAESLRNILVNQGDVVYGYVLKVLNSEELKVDYHMAGQQILLGICDGVGAAQLGKLPQVLKYTIVSVTAIFICFFMLGLLLAMWRFALFGLQ